MYRTSGILSDANIDVIIFDGKDWWLPGWESGIQIGDKNGPFTIKRDCIKELLWEYTLPTTQTQ